MSEAAWGRPARADAARMAARAAGSLRQPAKPSAKPLIAPADDGDVHILDLGEDGGGATVDTARALRAAGHDDQESPAQAKGSPQSKALACARRRLAEPGRDR
jgi:hypothetical protein